MLSQKFEVVPQGYIKDGTASYIANEVTGAIEAIEDINAVVFFIPKELKSDSNAKVDPKMFLSENIIKGLKFVVGPVTAEVAHLVPGKTATVNLKMSDHSGDIFIDGTGYLVLDLNKQYWSISRIFLTAVISNIPFVGSINQIIEANPV